MRALLLVVCLATGCTENERAKAFGGTMKVPLPCDRKLFDVTWKENDFWYATKPMVEADVAETYIYKAESGYDMFEGEVIVTERRCR